MGAVVSVGLCSWRGEGGGNKFLFPIQWREKHKLIPICVFIKELQWRASVVSRAKAEMEHGLELDSLPQQCVDHPVKMRADSLNSFDLPQFKKNIHDNT